MWHERLRKFLRHPASLIVWITLFCSAGKEQYPFSHFPMYSGFEDETWLLYFKRADGEPIQAKRAFRNTVARAKKRYGSLRDDYLEETGKEFDDLADADHEIIAGRLIEEYKANAPAKVKAKPDLDDVFNGPVTLVRIDVAYRDGEFRFSETELATR